MLDIEVSRSTPFDVLMAEAAAVCDQLATAPVAVPLMVGAPTVAGVVKITDDRLVCRVKVRTVPGGADKVKSVLRELVLRAFEAGRLTVPTPTGPVVQVHTSPLPTDD